MVELEVRLNFEIAWDYWETLTALYLAHAENCHHETDVGIMWAWKETQAKLANP